MNGATRWLRILDMGGDDPDLNLIAVPFAGGDVGSFRSWIGHLPAGVRLSAVQLPGRGARFAETVLTHWPTLIDELELAVQERSETRCVVFGHSAGALIAFELARRLCRRSGEPLALLVSGCRAPQLSSRQPRWTDAGDTALIERLAHLGGTPGEVLRSPELLDLLMPSIRADCTLYDEYRYRDAPPMNIPIIAFGGNHDALVDRDELGAWAAHTASGFQLHRLDAGHFYLHELSFLALLRTELKNLARQAVETDE